MMLSGRPERRGFDKLKSSMAETRLHLEKLRWEAWELLIFSGVGFIFLFFWVFSGVHLFSFCFVFFGLSACSGDFCNFGL